MRIRFRAFGKTLVSLTVDGDQSEAETRSMEAGSGHNFERSYVDSEDLPGLGFQA